jgi:hypothetical protein
MSKSSPVRQMQKISNMFPFFSDGLVLLMCSLAPKIYAKMINVPRLSFCVLEMSDVSRNMLDVSQLYPANAKSARYGRKLAHQHI